MNTLRGWITITILLITFTLSAGTAQAGIIVGNRAPEKSAAVCNEQSQKFDWAIIVGNIVGIIVGNFTALTLENPGEEPTENCAIIVGN